LFSLENIKNQSRDREKNVSKVSIKVDTEKINNNNNNLRWLRRKCLLCW